MEKLVRQSEAERLLEAGMFYPTGYIVSAHTSHSEAIIAADNLFNQHFSDSEVTIVKAEEMVRQAGLNLEHPAIFAAMGATIAVRQKQYDLAKNDGCSFILIHAATDEREEAAIRALSRGPIRYAVKYRRLVIENLLPKIPGADPDPEPARAR